MNWIEYTEGLKILFFRFGAFTKPEIDAGFLTWQRETKDDFLNWVNEQQTRPFLNSAKPKKSKEVKPIIYKHDKLVISESYLDNLKKKHNVSSLIELVEVMKNK